MASTKKPIIPTKTISNSKVAVTNLTKPVTGSTAVKKSLESTVVKKPSPIPVKPKTSVVVGKVTDASKVTKPSSPAKPVVKRVPDSTTKSVSLVVKAPASPVKASPGRVTSTKPAISSADATRKTVNALPKSPVSSVAKTTVKPAPKTGDTKTKLSSQVNTSVTKSTPPASPVSKPDVVVGGVKSSRPAVKSSLNAKPKATLPAVKSPVKSTVSGVKSAVSKPAVSKPALKASVRSPTAKTSKPGPSSRVTTVKSIRTRPSSTVSDAITRIQDECEVEVRDADSTTAEVSTVDEFLQSDTSPARLCLCPTETQFDERRAYAVAEQLLTVMNEGALQGLSAEETGLGTPDVHAGNSCVIDMTSVDVELSQPMNDSSQESGVSVENEIEEVNAEDQSSQQLVDSGSDEGEVSGVIDEDGKFDSAVDPEASSCGNGEVNERSCGSDEDATTAFEMEENGRKLDASETSDIVKVCNEVSEIAVDQNVVYEEEFTLETVTHPETSSLPEILEDVEGENAETLFELEPITGTCQNSLEEPCEEHLDDDPRLGQIDANVLIARTETSFEERHADKHDTDTVEDGISYEPCDINIGDRVLEEGTLNNGEASGEEVSEVTETANVPEPNTDDPALEDRDESEDRMVDISDFVPSVSGNDEDSAVEESVNNSNEAESADNEEPENDCPNAAFTCCEDVEDRVVVTEREQTPTNPDAESEIRCEYDEKFEVQNDSGFSSEVLGQLDQSESNDCDDSLENAMGIDENHFSSQLESEISDDQNSDGYVMLESRAEHPTADDHETPDDIVSLTSSDSVGFEEATGACEASQHPDDDDQPSVADHTEVTDCQSAPAGDDVTAAVSVTVESFIIGECVEMILGDGAVSDAPSDRHYADENAIPDHIDDEGFQRTRQKKSRKRNKKNERKVIAENKVIEKSANELVNDEYFDEHYHRKNSRRWKNSKKQNTIYGEPHWRYSLEN